MSEQAIESEIQAKGLNAPRLTPEAIDDLIFSERYLHCGRADWDAYNVGAGPIAAADVKLHTTDALGCLTICVLVLNNGFTVVGKSACASPENFDAELGRKIAREDARRQIWPLAGYALRERLADGAARYGLEASDDGGETWFDVDNSERSFSSGRLYRARVPEKTVGTFLEVPWRHRRSP